MKRIIGGWCHSCRTSHRSNTPHDEEFPCPPPTANRQVVVFDKKYHGFEDVVDVFRDVSEAFDSSFNPIMKGIPGEFQGTMRVTITYEPSEDDPRVE